jgi:hypothetical protein
MGRLRQVKAGTRRAFAGMGAVRAGQLNYVKRTPTPPPTNLTSPSGTSEEWKPQSSIPPKTRRRSLLTSLHCATLPFIAFLRRDKRSLRRPAGGFPRPPTLLTLPTSHSLQFTFTVHPASLRRRWCDPRRRTRRPILRSSHSIDRTLTPSQTGPPATDLAETQTH